MLTPRPSLWDRVMSRLALEPWDHSKLITLSTEDLQTQLDAARAHRQAAPRPWRPASITEALGVPAIFGAVTLISNIVGSLSLRALRNGALVSSTERPQLTVRPNPLTTPRDFFRETAWSMAVRGEAWWWVASRDGDGNATALVPVNPVEISAENPGGDWLRPTIRWRGVERRREDFRQIVLAREPGQLRGHGPLQACGAAISVAVEAQEWAANFFADGGHPSVVLHSEEPLGGSPDDEANEAQRLREQWVATPPNMPQVTSGPLSVKELGADIPAAQMLEGRNWNVGEIARMFQIPGSLLEYARQGSDITYQNVALEFDKLIRGCLLPNYLEPMEQTLGDLLPRSWVARFNTDALLRADIKTRFEVYEKAVTVLGPEEAAAYAREREGLAPGDIENAPIPFSPPGATVPIVRAASTNNVRCPRGHLLAELVTPPYRFTCPKCKAIVAA